MSFFNSTLHNRDVTLSEPFRHLCNQKRSLENARFNKLSQIPSPWLYHQVLNACDWCMKTEVLHAEMLFLTLQRSLNLYSGISLLN